MVPGGKARAVGGIKENGFFQVVGPAQDRGGTLFLVGAVWRHVRTLDQDLWFFGSDFGHSVAFLKDTSILRPDLGWVSIDD